MGSTPSVPIRAVVAEPALESTAVLLIRARHGDLKAREALASRYLPALRRFAHGRLPARARDLAETDDLVQNTVVRALNHLDRFEPRREGAFLAYLRQILVNQIRDEARRASSRPVRAELSEDLPAAGLSPLEEAIGRDDVELYEAALAKLAPPQREAIVLRVELGFSYDEVARSLGRQSPNAARMLIARAMVRLAAAIDELRGAH